MMRLFGVFALTLPLLLWSCSDDDETKLDGKVPDSSVNDLLVDDQPIQTPDGPTEDLPPSPDVEPDSDPGIPSSWTEVVTGTTGELYDVYSLDAKNVFAVGKGGLIMKYDGTSWTTMPNPDPDKNNLRALWDGGQNLFAVGDRVDVYYDGTKWNQGYASTYSYDFTDVWAATSGANLWATVESTSTYSTYFRYRAKTSPTGSWSSSSTSDFAGISFYGIWGLSDGELYAVGDQGKIVSCIGTCTGYSGTNWAEMTSPTSSNLRAIWGTSASDIFAVGFDGAILHYDGSSWTKMNANTSTYFYGVWGSSSSDVYAVGHPIFKADESIFHYDGSSWKKMPPPHTSYLNAVWGTSKSDVWVVGKTHILHYDGS
jgi:hypothetical protein